MSQKNVENMIGRLVTDERFRRQFAADPKAALAALVDQGIELTWCELKALASIDARRVERLADSIDETIRKADVQGGVR